MTESQLQERVARALVISRGGAIVASDAEWPAVVLHYREMSAKYPGYTKGFSLITDAFRDALAAMKAMREPTLDALDAGERAYRAARTQGVCGMTIEAQTRAECARFSAGWKAAFDAEISLAEGGKDGR